MQVFKHLATQWLAAVHCQSRVSAACAWLTFHNDARENVYSKKPTAVHQDRHIAVIHQNFSTYVSIRQGWLFNLENTPKVTKFYSDYYDLMPLALFGYFHTLSKQNLYTVEKLSVVFEKSVPTSLYSLTFQIP